jgi:hypothetical protein
LLMCACDLAHLSLSKMGDPVLCARWTFLPVSSVLVLVINTVTKSNIAIYISIFIFIDIYIYVPVPSTCFPCSPHSVMLNLKPIVIKTCPALSLIRTFSRFLDSPGVHAEKK